jgi:hypothetical protein
MPFRWNLKLRHSEKTITQPPTTVSPDWRSGALKIGQLAPDFELENHIGQKVRLSSYRRRCNVVLVFFPLAWTPI